MTTAPSVSIIIPAYNEEKIIKGCVHSLLQQTYNNIEIHIVDDESTDSTWSILEELRRNNPSKLKTYQFGKVGPGKARNKIALASSSDILAFMDADCEAFDDWIEKLVESFNSSDADSVGGPHWAPPQSNAFQKSVESFFTKFSGLTSFYKQESETVETDHNPLCNVAYRREAFQKLGGFREDLFPGEDYDFDWRLKQGGGKVLYNPKARVYHHRPENLSDFQKVLFAYGRAQGKLMRERGPHRKQHWIAIAFFLCFPLNVALWWVRLPQTYGFGAMFLASFDWFKGFLQGFVRNESPPPAHQPLERKL